MDAKDLANVGEELFTKRSSLMMLWQEQAENFYPERADFTFRRTLGTDFAANMMSSYPLMCRRELGDQIGVMLRPTAKEWFKISPIDPKRETNAAKRWLEGAAGVMRRAMYDRRSQFTRASKESDHDFAAFGQSVKQTRLNRNRDALLYQTHHLRDCAWKENEEGTIGMFFRKWKPTARDLKRLFKDGVHQEVNRMLPPDPTLLADLAAPTFWMTRDALQIEQKEEVCKRLGRSTDRGDAVVMAWAAGPTYITDGQAWAEGKKTGGKARPKVVMGRENRR